MNRRIADNLRDFAREHHVPRMLPLADGLERAVLGMVVNVDAYEQIKGVAEQVRVLDWENAPPNAKASLARINDLIAKVNAAVPPAYRIEPV